MKENEIDNNFEEETKILDGEMQLLEQLTSKLASSMKNYELNKQISMVDYQEILELIDRVKKTSLGKFVEDETFYSDLIKTLTEDVTIINSPDL